MKNYIKIKAFIIISLGVILLLSLLSFSYYDVHFFAYPVNLPPKNLIGIIGVFLGVVLFFTFGYSAYIIPLSMFLYGASCLGFIRFRGISTTKISALIGYILTLSSFSIILLLISHTFLEEDLYRIGGTIGFFLYVLFVQYLGVIGTSILAICFFTIGLSLSGLYTVIDLLKIIFRFFKVVGIKTIYILNRVVVQNRRIREKKSEKKEQVVVKKDSKELSTLPEIKIYTPTTASTPTSTVLSSNKSTNMKSTLLTKEYVGIEDKEDEEEKKEMSKLEVDSGKAFNPKTYKLPTIDLLKVPPSIDYRSIKEDIQTNIKNLEETLSEFGVGAKVVSVQKGPVVTRYELQPFPGVKIQKITSLSDDIALSMKTSQVRIVAPLPGRGTVGIEVPNHKSHVVYLREVLEDKVFQQSNSKLTLALGKDVAGNPIIADLKEMPHLLIAGTTGSGKTVCVNSIIISILFKAKPSEVKLLLVDPKMVELAPFSGIPHLIHPIISDAKKVFSALNWCVEEMSKRYQKLAEEGTRNIDIYNKEEFRMPYIVVIIDELADLMAVSKDNIENAIQRLSQLSRAVGIHLILATQRPSVDVITGVIKANFPARISFKVASKVDSRTVLDMIGAEKLLGRGDMLFLKPGIVKPIRAQGCYIEDEDIEKIVEAIRMQGGPIYEENIINSQKKLDLALEEDELFDEAVKIVLQTRQASASLLQRRLRVGYTRAARLLDLMEREGIVGPFQGSKPREIVVEPDTYLQEKYGEGTNN